jgi:hypothetical protein
MTLKLLAHGDTLARLEALAVRTRADMKVFLDHRAIVFAARGYSQDEIARRLSDLQDAVDMMLAKLQQHIDHEVWLSGQFGVVGKSLNQKDPNNAPSI